LPENIKESVDLPDFLKESVSKIQNLCTFQARFLGSLFRLAFQARFLGSLSRQSLKRIQARPFMEPDFLAMSE